MQEQSFIFQLIILSTIVLLLVGCAVILLFRLSLRQRKKYLEEKQSAQLLYLNEINQAKIDMKDDTLKHVAAELHDNVGQLIALVRIHIKTLQKKYPDEGQLVNANEITDQALQEIRRLSNTLNDEWVREFGLLQALESQKHFIERSGSLKLQIDLIGEEKDMNKDHALILYRICQEFFSNTLKYAEASLIIVRLEHGATHLKMSLSDNGKGFDLEGITLGNGFLNMQTRAKLLQAELDIDAQPNHGTQVLIQYPYSYETI